MVSAKRTLTDTDALAPSLNIAPGMFGNEPEPTFTHGVEL